MDMLIANTINEQDGGYPGEPLPDNGGSFPGKPHHYHLHQCIILITINVADVEDDHHQCPNDKHHKNDFIQAAIILNSTPSLPLRGVINDNIY